MKNILIFLLLFALSCAKEPTDNAPDCVTDGKGTFKIYNGLHVSMDVEILLNNGGPWSTWAGTLATKTLATGQTWTQEMAVGEYRVKAHGEEPGPYAHNSFDFSEIKTLDDCKDTEIDY